MQPPQQAATRRLVARLSLLVLAMFGFGYLLVPLYDVFCEVTGLNGKTGRITRVEAAATQVDMSRTVTVEFVTSVNAGFPWTFRPVVSRIDVHPGEETEVMFEAVNRSAGPVAGQAVPSVAPNEAARFFSKTECFCFTQQTLAAGEAKRMPVRFVVNPRLPQHIQTLTLGYTFFRSTAQAAANGDAAAANAPRS
ncbi:MAG: cytochrome c oxidase assembly protein [Gammaproteobacteria bacterium]